MVKIRRALLSVSDKQGLVELGRALTRHGVELISSGGTARQLRESDIPVESVATFTGAPEILGGRVKTLHPRVFGGILARSTDEHQAEVIEHNIPPIDLVVVNLYPFVETIQRAGVTRSEAVEQVDIGGPSLIRAAAKNHERVAVVVSPGDYGALIEALDTSGGELSLALRQRLAAQAFAYTAAYDVAISSYFSQEVAPQAGEVEATDKKKANEGVFAPELAVHLERAQALRYGENPHQQAAFYLPRGVTAPGFTQLQGKELSYNNLVDADAAWALARELPDTGVCVIKHTNACGAASVASGDVAEGFRRALAGDPVSAYGGIVACNTRVDEAFVRELKGIFFEALIAPDFDDAALARLSRKKKLRVLKVDPTCHPELQWRSAFSGLLLQQVDTGIEVVREGSVATKRAPEEEDWAELQFAWIVCKHIKSNAIVFTRDRQLVGVGAGQMSRVDSVKLALSRAVLPTEGGVVASDAFFPFRDGLDLCAEAGIRGVVQPGGSIRDDEVVTAADEHQLAMIFTGARHFRH
ncbi:MAG: bifunctional phosphoribosylaminoimidazolecarboxamide formyltransferase/IMP cyclohydrolase [Deltaproteobacteria bacterium]|nr:bifunctional phosphoribosylaminoimidazolecarboxamide formyltransferase/IMP cyclohydrolase [Deltaproteobacteria bacterium]